ncbi:uncharacterized protein BO88DRAFT_426211 [Aspergillus vadensis CBS 113365]|uniref:Uncharacterized protein n=1 Tax=Aspergillus vadensis (strain CBS 113365 / IMI 142717 / IBT 24658) TaxID=1448311 RepID=A0A319B5K9_ASPVC|nr:hypothetical protein BO88DRAFT_426211 [Aspergillus vadensis CBS 113365]PYH68097.1 hypothetical protein BO88DRAFT_426211 [Aspergillus vadensis CBS 113365]
MFMTERASKFSDVLHFTELSPHDDRRPDFQAASDESILTEKDDEIPSYDILNPSQNYDLLCDFELTGSYRKENYCLYKRVSGICKSILISLISLNLILHFSTRLWKRNERRQAKKKRTE